jgi:hypothetical protein
VQRAKRKAAFVESVEGSPKSRSMEAFSSEETTSSASSPKSQSWVAFSAAEFFWATCPFQGSRKTFAPCRAAISSVPSRTSSFSTTMISLVQPATLSKARPMRWASGPEIMQTEMGSLFIDDSQSAETGGEKRKAL